MIIRAFADIEILDLYLVKVQNSQCPQLQRHALSLRVLLCPSLRTLDWPVRTFSTLHTLSAKLIDKAASTKSRHSRLAIFKKRLLSTFENGKSSLAWYKNLGDVGEGVAQFQL